MDTDSLTGPLVPTQEQIDLTRELMTAPTQIVSIALTDFQLLKEAAQDRDRLLRERDSLLAHIAEEREARQRAELSLEAATGVRSGRSRIVIESGQGQTRVIIGEEQ